MLFCGVSRSLSRVVVLSRSTTGTRTVSRRSPRSTSSVDLLADGARVDVDAELAAVLHALAVEASARCRRAAGPALAAGLPSSTSATITPASAASFSASASVAVTVCVADADLAAAHPAALADLFEDVADDVARRGEADALVAARLRVDQAC